MKREQLHKWLINGIAGVLCLAVLAVVGITLINRYSGESEGARSEDQTRVLAKAWRDGIAKDDSRRTVLLAERIISSTDGATMPEVSYLQFFRRYGLSSQALTAASGKPDYQHWRDAIDLQQLAERIVNSPDVALEELFAVVNAEIRLSEQSQPTYLISDIWRRKAGTPEDRIRLLGGLAAYYGYQMLVVYLPDATGKPFYPLAEFTKNGHTVVADVLCSRIYRNVRVAEMQPPDDWHAELKTAIRRPLIYFIPGELADYRQSTRRLVRSLNDNKFKNVPVFSVDNPQELLNTLTRNERIPAAQIFFWPYPIEGAVNSSQLPAEWRFRSDADKPPVPPRANKEK